MGQVTTQLRLERVPIRRFDRPLPSLIVNGRTAIKDQRPDPNQRELGSFSGRIPLKAFIDERSSNQDTPYKLRALLQIFVNRSDHKDLYHRVSIRTLDDPDGDALERWVGGNGLRRFVQRA